LDVILKAFFCPRHMNPS